jgi:hypothetical protein
MTNMIAPFVVNIWLQIMLAEGDDGMRRERGKFLVHLPRPPKGYKRHKAIYRGEGPRPEVPVAQEKLFGCKLTGLSLSAIIHHMDIGKQGS